MYRKWTRNSCDLHNECIESGPAIHVMLHNSITDHLRWATTNVIREDTHSQSLWLRPFSHWWKMYKGQWLVAAKLQGMFSEASYKSTEYQSQRMS